MVPLSLHALLGLDNKDKESVPVLSISGNSSRAEYLQGVQTYLKKKKAIATQTSTPGLSKRSQSLLILSSEGRHTEALVRLCTNLENPLQEMNLKLELSLEADNLVTPPDNSLPKLYAFIY